VIGNFLQLHETEEFLEHPLRSFMDFMDPGARFNIQVLVDLKLVELAMFD
jgi:hypothetical protein